MLRTYTRRVYLPSRKTHHECLPLSSTPRASQLQQFSLCCEFNITQTRDASQQTLGMRHRQHYCNTPHDYLYAHVANSSSVTNTLFRAVAEKIIHFSHRQGGRLPAYAVAAAGCRCGPNCGAAAAPAPAVAAAAAAAVAVAVATAVATSAAATSTIPSGRGTTLLSTAVAPDGVTLLCSSNPRPPFPSAIMPFRLHDLASLVGLRWRSWLARTRSILLPCRPSDRGRRSGHTLNSIPGE